MNKALNKSQTRIKKKKKTGTETYRVHEDNTCFGREYRVHEDKSASYEDTDSADENGRYTGELV